MRQWLFQNPVSCLPRQYLWTSWRHTDVVEEGHAKYCDTARERGDIGMTESRTSYGQPRLDTNTHSHPLWCLVCQVFKFVKQQWVVSVVCENLCVGVCGSVCVCNVQFVFCWFGRVLDQNLFFIAQRKCLNRPNLFVLVNMSYFAFLSCVLIEDPSWSHMWS